MTLEPEEETYALVVGFDALFRQLHEGTIRYGCCGELKSSGHHPACRYAMPDEPWQEETLFAAA